MVRLYGNRAREVAIQNALMTRISARHERSIRLEIAKTMRRASTAYEKDGDIGVDMAMAGHAENIEGILSGLWQNSIKTFSDRVQIGKSRKSMFEDIVRLWFGQKVYDTIVRVSQTTKAQIREIIFRGQKEGSSIPEISKEISKKAPQLSIYRASVIARTETHASGVFGSLETAKQIDDTMKKEWLAADDERVRQPPESTFDHAIVNGQIVGMKEFFDVSGEFLEAPGDSRGSAGNIINCRCVLGYVRP